MRYSLRIYFISCVIIYFELSYIWKLLKQYGVKNSSFTMNVIYKNKKQKIYQVFKWKKKKFISMINWMTWSENSEIIWGGKDFLI